MAVSLEEAAAFQKVTRGDKLYLQHALYMQIQQQSESRRVFQIKKALPLRLQQRAPRLQPQLRVAGIAGRKARGSGPVQQRQIEMRHAEALDAALSEIVGAAARA